jgi:hypothetical protein
VQDYTHEQAVADGVNVGCVQVVNAGAVDDGFVADVIRLAVKRATLYAAPGHPCGDADLKLVRCLPYAAADILLALVRDGVSLQCPFPAVFSLVHKSHAT